MSITSDLVSFFLLVLGALGGIWLRIEAVVKAARNEALLAAQTAATKSDIVAVALAEHKLHVAETYVSKAGMREQTGQIMDLLRDVQGDVGNINERIDRIFEGHPSARRSRAKPA